jgi:hypothetical protein
MANPLPRPHNRYESASRNPASMHSAGTAQGAAGIPPRRFCCKIMKDLEGT